MGERIDHVDGMTIEDSEHMLAARLFQNTARVHFNLHVERAGRFGRRIVYGGHIISLARALSFNGLANAFAIVGINGGRHVNPVFAGDTDLRLVGNPGRRHGARARRCRPAARAHRGHPRRAGGWIPGPGCGREVRRVRGTRFRLLGGDAHAAQPAIGGLTGRVAAPGRTGRGALGGVFPPPSRRPRAPLMFRQQTFPSLPDP